MPIINPSDTATPNEDFQPIKDKASRVLGAIDSLLSQAGIEIENGLVPIDTPIINMFTTSISDGLQDTDTLTGEPLSESVDENTLPLGEMPVIEGEENPLQSLHDEIRNLGSELKTYARAEDVEKTLNRMIPKIASMAASQVRIPECNCGGDDFDIESLSPEEMAGDVPRRKRR